MSLVKILKEIETNEPNAGMSLELGSPATLNARGGLKRAATEAIKRLKADYHKELSKSTLFIVVTGPGNGAFTEVASGDAFGCFSEDPEALFKDMASKIDKSLFGRESVSRLFYIAGNVLEDKALELGIDSYNPFLFSEKYNSSVNRAEDLVPLLKRAIVDQTGSEIVGINAVKSIVDKALEKKHSAAVTPLILSTPDNNFALDLYKNLTRLTTKVFLVVAGKAPKALASTTGAILVKTVTDESVGEVLATIRSKVL